MKGVVILYRGFIFTNIRALHLSRWKAIFHLFSRILSLSRSCVGIGFYCKVSDCVVSKKKGVWWNYGKPGCHLHVYKTGTN